MSLDGAKIDEGTEVSEDGGRPPIRSQGPWARFRRWRWLTWLLLAISVIIAATASILLTVASDYRPLTYGLDGTGGLAYPGLRAGHGIRVVNNIGHFREDLYIPPQRGTFYLFVSVLNTGTRAVIVEKLTLPRFSHLVLAGPVRYSRQAPPERQAYCRPNAFCIT